MLEAIERGNDLPTGTVYLTEDQTAGRGQGNNRWHSTAGANLTLSLLLRPDHLSVDRLFVLTQVASLAVHDAVRDHLPGSLAPGVRIKWPNDLYVEDRKLAGILIQNGLRGNRINWSVVGTGLNVNEAAFPPELEQAATSLYLLTGKPVERGEVLKRYFDHIIQWHKLLAEENYPEIDREYQQRLYRRGETVAFLDLEKNERFTATVRGTDAMGRLQLRRSDGNEESYELRSLRWLLR